MKKQSWVPWVAGGIAAAGVGTVVVAARRRAAMAVGPETIRGAARRFFLVHEALRRNLDRFIAIVDRDEAHDVEAFAQLVHDYAEFLKKHHEGEDRFVFPMLRRHGMLRSTDAAHLDAWTAEHHEVNRLADALAGAADQVRASGRAAYGELRGTALELDEILRPHLAAEEQLLNAERLAEIVPPEVLRDLEEEMRKKLYSDERMLLFYMHSLAADEQKAVLGQAPAIFRKLILPRWDRRLYARLAPLSLEPRISA